MDTQRLLKIAPRYHRSLYVPLQLHPDESNLKITQCPVCASDRLTPIISVENGDGQESMVRSFCRDCSHVSFTRRPDYEWFRNFYAKTWDPTGAVPEIKLGTYDAIASVLMPFVPDKKAHILEIGTGYGGALQTLRNHGYSNLYGIDASTRRADYAKSLGFHVTSTTIEEMDRNPVIAAGAPYDAVYSWHVFEHVHDPFLAVQNIAKMLKPDGVLFICVPHAEAEHQFFIGHYLPHIHSYCEKSLSTLLMRHGFGIEHADDSLRIVGKLGSAGNPAFQAPVFDIPGKIRAKLVRDFGLRQMPSDYSGTASLHYSQYRGSNEILEPSYGYLLPIDAESSALRKATAMLKQSAIGLEVEVDGGGSGGVGVKTLTRNIAKRTVGHRLNEVIGDFELHSDEKAFKTIDRVVVKYSEAKTLCYIK